MSVTITTKYNYTCDGCGKQRTTTKELPPSWRKWIATNNPDAKLKEKNLHICGKCDTSIIHMINTKSIQRN